MFALSYYLMLFNITDKSIVAYAYMNGTWYTAASVAFTGIISIFFGVYVAMWLFRKDILKQRKRSAPSIMGAGGALSGIMVAGCPTCGAPALALFGAPLALMALPFKGLEIKIASIALLFLSIYWLTENVYRQVFGACELSTSP